MRDRKDDPFHHQLFHLPCVLGDFSRVWLFATLWTLACQAPLSTVFPRQEYWSGLHALLQGIFSTQESNPHLYVFWLPNGFFTTSATWETLQSCKAYFKEVIQLKVCIHRHYSWKTTLKINLANGSALHEKPWKKQLVTKGTSCISWR